MADTCHSCQAPIVWAVAKASGRFMPVDAEPDPEKGNVELRPSDSPTATAPTAIVHAQPPLFGGPYHLSHFVTCPHADQWRGRRP